MEIFFKDLVIFNLMHSLVEYLPFNGKVLASTEVVPSSGTVTTDYLNMINRLEKRKNIYFAV